MATEPVAYFLTWTTYGTWLHGRDPASVDRDHSAPGTPLLDPDPVREAANREAMRQPEYRLDAVRQMVVLRAILAVSRHRGWRVWAAHVRTNHVHVVVSGDCPPEKMLVDFKAWASRRLREAFGEDEDRDRWTQHGSTRYVWKEEMAWEKVAYVLHEQGQPMSVYNGSVEEHHPCPSEPEA